MKQHGASGHQRSDLARLQRWTPLAMLVTCHARPTQHNQAAATRSIRQHGKCANSRRLCCVPLRALSWSSDGSANSKPSSYQSPAAGNGTFLLMLLCVVCFLLDHVLNLPFMNKLYLYSAKPQWWQFVTHQFCHGNLQHLSSNLFQLCVFGRFVEETEGAVGVIFIYLITGLGAAAASTFLLPNSVSVGASGAIFGLFATSVLLRLTRGPSIKALLEAVVLGNFVVRQVMEEMRHQVMGGLSMSGMRIAHVAHLGGALAGVLLVLMLSRLPAGEEKSI